MTGSRRRSILAAGAALPLLAIRTRPAGAAEFTYKWANNLPVAHPLNVRGAEAVARIKDRTGGRLEIQVFPNNQLGSDTDTLSQLRSGAVEFFTLSGLILATLVPPASINGMGFAFANYAAVWAAMDGPLGAFVRAEIGKRGLFAMERIWDNGFRQTTTSSRAVTAPADLRGLKLRVPPSPLWTSMFNALGAAPTSINFSETYSALQTRVVDGQENPLAIIETARLYEVQRFCSLTNHMWDGFWFLANARAWQRLPRDVQEIAQAELNASALQEREDVAKLNAELQAKLAQRGMQFNPVDPGPFRDRLKEAGFYKEWRGRYGEEAWKVLEGAVGAIT
ncbi:TRAP transporter substrate-binding protein [Paracraurococcus ruber]|uniref:ABC transporter substrate-binding protein n=1 Tax=Paracraurococcus ruber TaxID=77675 RepID=A0ABS1D5I5_9PROT|nr:TRAP transporter substrate-binding protein [Paracraurococcus ruber]MBK1661758.1 ABC transporter substrate-binding protein [Paracraurococcus ruber]TDG26651.1 TRAP transporter substrate-binding protein [Paracraurococcus ruber]